MNHKVQTDTTPTVLPDQLIQDIQQVINTAKHSVSFQVNCELVVSYWHIGKLIVEHEQANGVDSKTSRQIILQLAKRLTSELGKGFSRSNLFNMRRFYLTYADVQTLSGHLSWSHICELLVISDEHKRSFYEKETLNAHWSVRELRGFFCKMIDISKLDIANHEFTGEELGELLLTSVKQMKNGEVAKTHHIETRQTQT